MSMIGQRFGRLTVVVKTEKSTHLIGRWRTSWICRCDCGKEATIRGDSLKSGRTRSCGCLDQMDLTSRRFGRLIVLGRAEREGHDSRWLCRCDCGTETIVSTANFARTKSCGCFNKEIASQRMTKHGHARENHNGGKSITWRRWEAMRERCLEPNHSSFAAYGGMGIVVCAGWRIDFVNFLQDMGECPPGLTIDRIQNDGGYWCGHCKECVANEWPKNCRWATAKEQARNKTTNRLLTIKGETLCAVEWAERSNVPYRIVMQRIYHGWNIEDAVFRLPNPNKTKTKQRQKKVQICA